MSLSDGTNRTTYKPADLAEQIEGARPNTTDPAKSNRLGIGTTILVTLIIAGIGWKIATKLERNKTNKASTQKFLEIDNKDHSGIRQYFKEVLIREASSNPGQETDLDLERDLGLFSPPILAARPYMEDGKFFIEIQIDPFGDDPEPVSCEIREATHKIPCLDKHRGIKTLQFAAPPNLVKAFEALSRACPDGKYSPEAEQREVEEGELWLPDELWKIITDNCPSQGCTPEEMKRAIEEAIMQKLVEHIAGGSGMEWSEVTSQ